METERITSRHNPAIAETVKLLGDRKARREAGLLAAEGTKLLSDAAESGAEIRYAIAAESIAEALPRFAAERLLLVPDRLFEAISTQKSPQGVLFVCRSPDAPPHLTGSRYAVLDGLQDPGNVGTVIRTAAAFGVDGVLLCGASADPFGPKAVRASMGAVFRIPVCEWEVSRIRQECADAGIRLLAAMPAGDAADIRSVCDARIAAVIGSEGAGVGREMLDACDGRLTIPMAKGAESLNAAAAAAVILWEIARNRI